MISSVVLSPALIDSHAKLSIAYNAMGLQPPRLSAAVAGGREVVRLKSGGCDR